MPQIIVQSTPTTTATPPPGIVIGPILVPDPPVKNCPTNAPITVTIAMIGVSGYSGVFHFRLRTHSAPIFSRYKGCEMAIISQAKRKPNEDRLATKMYALEGKK